MEANLKTTKLDWRESILLATFVDPLYLLVSLSTSFNPLQFTISPLLFF